MLKGGREKGGGGCLNHVLDLAGAYIESIIHKCCLRAVEACPDPECRRALRALADTFALHTISQDMLFRNEEYIAPAKAKAIQRLLVDLYSELRGVAVPLVNAFGIPDHILRAPIGIQGDAGVADMYKEYLLAAGFDV
ncbi:acyl-CoA dehydrogenase/oxidase C-terminal [Haematococcus lacustris]